MTKIDGHLPGRLHGAAAGCPFCRAAHDIFTVPKAGTRFRFLSDFQAGKTGTVLNDLSPVPDDRFLARLDGEPEHIQTRVTATDLIEILPSPEPPTWTLSVQPRIAAELDQIIVVFCEAGNHPGGWTINWISYFEVVRFVWSKRLPLEETEIWSALKAHGIPGKFQSDLSYFFSKGRDLLVYSVGKKPIKKIVSVRLQMPDPESEKWMNNSLIRQIRVDALFLRISVREE